MIAPFQAVEYNLLSPQAIVNGASFTVNVLDGLGAAYAEIAVTLGATDIALTALKVQESDVKASATALTSGADVVGTRFGTDANDTGSTSTLPSATDDNKIFKFFIDLRGRKRYLLPVVTIGTGATGGFVQVSARLWRLQDAPRTAVESGLAQRMVV